MISTANCSYARTDTVLRELNPIEYLWGYAKGNDLANFAPKELWELSRAARKAFSRVRKVKRCLRAFWVQSNLDIEGL